MSEKSAYDEFLDSIYWANGPEPEPGPPDPEFVDEDED